MAGFDAAFARVRAILSFPILLALLLMGCGGDGSGDAPGGEVALKRAFPNLTFSQPVLAIQTPRDGDWWYVVEKAGRIYRFDARDPAASQAFLVVDLSDRVNPVGEGGLLGMAFHPNFPATPEIYLSYTGDDPKTGFESRIARYTSDDDGARIDSGSEQIILSAPQPNTNHNGGNIAFGADGYLYIGLGDGGGSGDPDDNAQNPDTLLGTMLRIDVDSDDPYAIPSDNPFVSGGGQREIYAFGLRNPWRWSFDRVDGATLWAGDVGQNAWEEIDIIERGGNYGWRCYEGNAEYNLAGCQARDTYDFPLAVYGRDEGHSVTGGYVYRGNYITLLKGTYVFGDFISGRIWGLSSEDGTWQRRTLIGSNSGLSIVSFAEDHSGELYVVDFGGGLYRLVSSEP
jgi:glucose/arabinose dehydrogenase